MHFSAPAAKRLLCVVIGFCATLGITQVFHVGKTDPFPTIGQSPPSSETRTFVSQPMYLVNRSHKGDKLKVHPSGSSAVQSPLPIEPMQNVPAATKPAHQIKIGCELPMATFGIVQNVGTEFGRCLANRSIPDLAIG